ncbi:unannotated protein [freshwater metagenome]|uniref:Unannotated protein n=1 Tax=freshwater metagenome TaxID=449393 RepID=A0A6J6HDW8_9ZZZZ|nr:hypothetical protein [Actinomycetota bacterium]
MTIISDPAQPAVTLAVETWSDPVIDQLGHDPRSAYVEKFWLPILGPSSVWLLRRIADGLDRHPEGFELDLVDTAQSLGVGMRGGRNAPLLRTFERCCRFGAARMHGTSSISVRRRLAPLTRTQTERLPDSLRAEHDQWLSRPSTSPSFEQMQTRARSLALSMIQIGEDNQNVERQLHRWRFHPAIAHDALRWALAHCPHREPMQTTSPTRNLVSGDAA